MRKLCLKAVCVSGLFLFVLMMSCHSTVQREGKQTDLSGDWWGSDWGWVTIQGNRGTYTYSNGPQPGKLEFHRTGENTYRGTWGDQKEHGTMSFTVSEDGQKMVGTYTNDKDRKIPPEPATILWVRKSWQVNAVAFSPDGRTVASGSADSTVQLWQATNGSCVRRLLGHQGWVMSVAFSPDGTTLASGSEDKTVRLWRVTDGSCVRELSGHAAAVTAVAFSPDGATLATGSLDDSIRLWRVSDGAVLRTLLGHGDFVNSVAFSPDGKMLASAGDDQTIKLWRVADGAEMKTLTGHQDYVFCVAFSPDGQRLASGGGMRDRTVRLWRVSDGSLERSWEASAKAVKSVAFSPDGATLASGGGRMDHSIGLWQVNQGTLLRKITGIALVLPAVAPRYGAGPIQITGHSGSVLSVAFSPDGTTLATGSIDKTLRMWRVADGTLVWMTPGQ
jgi:WD40 repeat protein